MIKNRFFFLLATTLFLTACSDGFLINDSAKSKKETQESFDLASVDTGPGENYKPTIDPSLNFSLYRASYEYKVENGVTKHHCVRLQFIEDQLAMEDCMKMRKVNIGRDEEKPNDDPVNPQRLFSTGRFKGKHAWNYVCLTDKGVEKYTKTRSCDIVNKL